MATITGTSGADTYSSADSIASADYYDLLSGNDTVTAGGGDDTLIGLGGDDRLNGGAGNDSMVGGDGNDYYYVDSIYDVVDESGTGTIDRVFSTVDWTLGANIEFLSFYTYSSSGRIGTGNTLNNTIYGSNYNDSLYGLDGNDSLQGWNGDDTLYGGNGNDTLHDTLEDGGADYMYGGDGNDTLVGGNHRENGATGLGDYLSGEAGDDNITATSAESTVYGGEGNDTISLQETDSVAYGENGNDNIHLLYAHADPDGPYTNPHEATVGGGAGDDTITVTFKDPTDIISHSIFGGSGTDSLQYKHNDAAGTGSEYYVKIDLSSSQTVTIHLEADDSIIFTQSVSGFENVIGDDTHDILIGDGTDNAFHGFLGDDNIDGGGGNDTVTYENASSLVVDLSDTVGSNVSGSHGSDTLTNIENVTGGSSHDAITGNSIANRLDGGSGNDTLSGNDGNDTLVAGLGNDSLIGGTGDDTVDYSATSAGITIDLSSGAGQSIAGGFGTDTLSGIECVIGGTGNDSLTGTTGNNTLQGGAGNDSLSGGSGTDTASYAGITSAVTIDLSAGTPTATGGAGNDTLSSIEDIIGGESDDSITGSSSANSLNGSAGHDLVDGGAGNDTLVGGTGDDTLFGMDGNDLLSDTSGVNTLKGVDGDDTISGGTGADYIFGGDGSDSLTGSTGADRFVFDHSLNSSFDTVTDFAVSVTNEKIILDDDVFTSLSVGNLAAANFKAGTAAGDANDYIIYDVATGSLYYDVDGTGATAQIKFAVLSNLASINDTDFTVWA